ncbi:hypothetical protein JYU34_020000, partial [Plutella xylostella]
SYVPTLSSGLELINWDMSDNPSAQELINWGLRDNPSALELDKGWSPTDRGESVHASLAIFVAGGAKVQLDSITMENVVITHAGNAPGATSVLSPAGNEHQVTNSGSYSINGILGIEQVEGLHNGGGLKRKRHEEQDENRDFNSHSEDDVKRQRSHYNGDQIYSNLWSSSKWTLKDEYKLLSELGGATATAATGYYGELFDAPYEHAAHPHYTPHS